MDRKLARELNDNVGKTVLICGWVHAKRSHGKICFIDVRDRTGLTQVVILPGNPSYELAEGVSIESVVSIVGCVQERPSGMVNDDIVSGHVELQAQEFNIISQSKMLPFEIGDTRNINEELRLQYRYLDLRNKRMYANIVSRSKALQFVIDYLAKNDFNYIQTPILSKSTPEGARDYLVPSRIHKGKFFALPQSPQQYKQLLMVAGFERYFQISPCFRDEDARADRSPGEFYQIDIEMSFVEQEDILRLTENMFTELIAKLFPEKKITLTPFPRLTHSQAMERYNTDKPDLRKDKNDSNELAFVWIVDFPLFNKQSKDDYFHGSGKSQWAPSHHMFTAPKKEDLYLLDTEPGKVKSYQHDLVLNGIEVGGGSIRIHDPKLQNQIWDLIGFNAEQKKQFKHLIEAFEYGVPPHGGIAPGFDRLISLLSGEPNIREVIAFPLNQDGRDPLMDSPSPVDPKQLQELHISITSK
ncbi:hypothetical protein AUK41_01170 [Candidatus Berkelbacteria bacterium CG2_30_43_20]|uniref:Aspartate--tRNA(Asp/Asn) ligase n=1 Tax=Candidatus Berkelbacteria bacterium CG10_big_fil_rev_8_21_14_0_10_43_14 TaxID=1974515 RepID=A0A2M6RAE1_9BACT|nr:MAG: hypothetical protein AUK41_01170 [Candidatus Berkelbacteria bacterium CG2_30_43_20]PIS06941.1 MAG: aspartate--tRNA ligase [Candidatus Berkelbacteria bacterium CG10_big_fil_rev_8_21_14_0_10_43_14]